MARTRMLEPVGSLNLKGMLLLNANI